LPLAKLLKQAPSFRRRAYIVLVILKGEHFPRCSRCADAVLFDLIHAAPDLYSHHVQRIYELPVLDEESAARA
jgi:hypothetical protein